MEKAHKVKRLGWTISVAHSGHTKHLRSLRLATFTVSVTAASCEGRKGKVTHGAPVTMEGQAIVYPGQAILIS